MRSNRAYPRSGKLVNNDVRAFTLIELLVVIAIISLLVSILLPSLIKAKALALQAVCVSNLHNAGIAFALYGSEHEFHYPRTNIFSDWQLQPDAPPWYATLKAYSETCAVFNCPVTNQLCPGTEAKDVFDLFGPVEYNRSRYGYVSNYAYNHMNFGGGWKWATTDTDGFYNEEESRELFERRNVPFDRGMVVMCGTAHVYIAKPWPSPHRGNIYNPIFYVHGDQDQVNVLFPDWHVEAANYDDVRDYNKWWTEWIFYVAP